MADKVKRFRVHVAKELYETERDYTLNLEFTVTVSDQRVRGQLATLHAQCGGLSGIQL